LQLIAAVGAFLGQPVGDEDVDFVGRLGVAVGGEHQFLAIKRKERPAIATMPVGPRENLHLQAARIIITLA